jgi:hypothetical protein
LANPVEQDHLIALLKEENKRQSGFNMFSACDSQTIITKGHERLQGLLGNLLQKFNR